MVWTTPLGISWLWSSSETSHSHHSYYHLQVTHLQMGLHRAGNSPVSLLPGSATSILSQLHWLPWHSTLTSSSCNLTLGKVIPSLRRAPNYSTSDSSPLAYLLVLRMSLTKAKKKKKTVYSTVIIYAAIPTGKKKTGSKCTKTKEGFSLDHGIYEPFSSLFLCFV